MDASGDHSQGRRQRVETHGPVARPQPVRLRSLSRRRDRRLLPQLDRERAGHHAYFRRPERRGQRQIDGQVRQAVRRHRRLRGLLYGRSEIPRTRFLRQAHGQEEPRAGLHRRLFPRQGQADGRAGRRHYYDQGHVGSDSAAPRRHAGQAVQEEHRHSGRFPYPLYARLRPCIGTCGDHRRRRCRRYQLLVFRRRHGRPGHRAGARLLQEARRRYRCEHGGRRQDQHPAARDPQGTQPVGIRHGETRTQALQSAHRHAARRDRRAVRQGDQGRSGRRRGRDDRCLPQDRGLLRLPGTQRTGAEGRDSRRHVFEHGRPAQAAQGRGHPAARHGADSLGAPCCGSAAAGDPDFADRGRAGRELRPRREGRTSDVHQQKLAVRGAGEGRVRTYAREDRPRIPLQDLRRPRGDSLRYVEIPDAAQSGASRSRRRETRRQREGGPAARTLPAGRQELPDGHEGQGLRRFEARGTQGRGEEGRGECCGRHYGQYRYGAAARPHHRIQGEGRRYGKSGSGNRCSRSHEDGELRDDRLRRHRQADSGASRRQRGHRRRAGRDRIVPSGLFIRRKAARVLRTAFLIADSVNIAIFVPSINLTSDLWHFSKNSRSLPSRET